MKPFLLREYDGPRYLPTPAELRAARRRRSYDVQGLLVAAGLFAVAGLLAIAWFG